MDSIAFAFCDAVVGTIKDLPRVDVPFRDAKWNKAFQDHTANRKYFQLYVGFSDGKWSCELFNLKCRSIAPLTTLLALVGRKYLRINYIEVSAGWCFNNTSKKELHMLIESLNPFLNFPKLLLDDFYSKIPDSDVADLLSLFAKINIFSFFSCCNGRRALEFAKQLIQEDTLVKKITTLCARNLLEDEIAAYRATGRVVYVKTRPPTYGTSLRFVR